MVAGHAGQQILGLAPGGRAPYVLVNRGLDGGELLLQGGKDELDRAPGLAVGEMRCPIALGHHHRDDLTASPGAPLAERI